MNWEPNTPRCDRRRVFNRSDIGTLRTWFNGFIRYDTSSGLSVARARCLASLKRLVTMGGGGVETRRHDKYAN